MYVNSFSYQNKDHALNENTEKPHDKSNSLYTDFEFLGQTKLVFVDMTSSLWIEKKNNFRAVSNWSATFK